MSSSTRITCDGCGAVLREHDDGDGDRSVDLTLTSTDAADPDTGNFRWRSASWDLCARCAGTVFLTLVAAVGPANRDDLSEVLS